MASKGIIYEYEDGGKYCGEWENDAAHGHGVCTGPNGNGLFQGLWERGYQASGVFTWPSGQRYMGKWRQGVREGFGKETKPDGTEYCGEFTRDSRGPCGVLRQPNGVVYRGTWKDGVQNGEGTEVYIDGGMYRGEYRNGLRYGHGTRSSSNYERSTVKEPHSATSSVTSSVDESIESLASALEDPSTLPIIISVTMSDKTNAQIYEGEWQDDKRHGYGVLKIVGHHTYYGQWEENMRSGYGVTYYDEEKRKEEGQWQRGKLVTKLKRKKLQLKSKQLETRVNQAHMSALHAAETARSKADLAEGRAITANAKSRAAMRAAQQAIKDAECAEGIEKLHKNAPKIQEHMQSPVTESFSAGDAPLRAADQEKSGPDSLLSPPQGIPLTPSFEDLASLASGERTPRGYDEEDSSSNDSGDEFSEPSANGEYRSVGRERHSPKLFRRSHVDAQDKRHRFRSSRHSSADMTLFEREKSEKKDARSASEMAGGESRELRVKRNALLRIHQATESDPTFLDKLPAPSSSSSAREGRGHKRVASGSALFREAVCGRESELRPRHVNKATGEPDHGDLTDEEEVVSASSKTNPATSVTERSPQAVSVEVLQQMANWNRTVAYLNLGLLFVLLFLVVTVVLCMNYYWLVYQMSPSHPAGSSGGSVSNIDLSLGPMA